MDLHLPLLADVNFHVGIAAEACADGAWATARSNLEKADVSFEELRGLWPAMGVTERGLMAAMVKPLKERYDAALKQVPPLRAVSQGSVERDAEADSPPE